MTASRRLRDRERLAKEVADLEADDEDRTLIRLVAAEMEDLRAAW